MTLPLVALVDFDGVILKSPHAAKYINHKVTSYVGKRMNVSYHVAAAINRELYTAYGHTYLGLKAHGFATNLRDFNNDIYGVPDEWRGIVSDNQEWEAFLDHMNRLDVPVKLFSNADKRWLTSFIPYEQHIYSLQDYIETFDNLELLKPESSVYEFVHYHLPKCRYVFLDDKLGNFTKQSDQRWAHVWITPEARGSYKLKENHYMSSDLLSSVEVIRRLSRN
jgi:FMN phosphatase YigB (HAD superfamily)